MFKQIDQRLDWPGEAISPRRGLFETRRDAHHRWPESNQLCNLSPPLNALGAAVSIRARLRFERSGSQERRKGTRALIGFSSLGAPLLLSWPPHRSAAIEIVKFLAGLDNNIKRPIETPEGGCANSPVCTSRVVLAIFALSRPSACSIASAAPDAAPSIAAATSERKEPCPYHAGEDG